VVDLLHNEDIVEEIGSKRQGVVDSVGSSRAGDQETQNNWHVRFTDGKEPLLKIFTFERELRLVQCPHGGAETPFQL
jgi:hypothetical protein